MYVDAHNPDEDSCSGSGSYCDPKVSLRDTGGNAIPYVGYVDYLSLSGKCFVFGSGGAFLGVSCTYNTEVACYVDCGEIMDANFPPPPPPWLELPLWARTQPGKWHLACQSTY